MRYGCRPGSFGSPRYCSFSARIDFAVFLLSNSVWLWSVNALTFLLGFCLPCWIVSNFTGIIHLFAIDSNTLLRLCNRWYYYLLGKNFVLFLSCIFDTVPWICFFSFKGKAVLFNDCQNRRYFSLLLIMSSTTTAPITKDGGRELMLAKAMDEKCTREQAEAWLIVASTLKKPSPTDNNSSLFEVEVFFNRYLLMFIFFPWIRVYPF